jgi:cation diffusion facilitator CzcD-associated flavoprotein CzcO
VAIIGSGASAAQVIPTIAPDVKELHIFQRTPHWVLPRPDKKFSAVEQELLGNNLVYQAVRKSIYWSLETRVIGFKYSPFMLKLVAAKRSFSLSEKSNT